MTGRDQEGSKLADHVGTPARLQFHFRTPQPGLNSSYRRSDIYVPPCLFFHHPPPPAKSSIGLPSHPRTGCRPWSFPPRVGAPPPRRERHALSIPNSLQSSSCSDSVLPSFRDPPFHESLPWRNQSTLLFLDQLIQGPIPNDDAFLSSALDSRLLSSPPPYTPGSEKPVHPPSPSILQPPTSNDLIPPLPIEFTQSSLPSPSSPRKF